MIISLRARLAVYLTFVLSTTIPGHGRASIDEHIQPAVTTACNAIDGDTLRCGAARIRLIGIDAAELPGHCRTGRRCASGNPHAQHGALKRLSEGKLTIWPVATDKYGRIVARVRNSAGLDLSCAMIAQGATYKPQWDNDRIVARTCPKVAR